MPQNTNLGCLNKKKDMYREGSLRSAWAEQPESRFPTVSRTSAKRLLDERRARSFFFEFPPSPSESAQRYASGETVR